MKNIIKLEEVAFTTAAIYFLYLFNLGLPVWIWLLLFFSPDISMVGYLINTRAGAIAYNLFHHRGLALVLAFAGFFLHLPLLLAIGILLVAHSSFDRAFGYGLKFNDDFKHTHLGWLPGKNKATVAA